MVAILAEAVVAWVAASPGETYTLPRYEVVDTTRVAREAVTLREIIQRCVEGEKTKLSGHRDMTYSFTVRSLVLWKKKKEIEDDVFLAYEDSTGFGRTLSLEKSVRHFKKKGDGWVEDAGDRDRDSPIRVTADDEDSENLFTRLPFFLEEQQEFDFELLDRTLEEDHVIFKVGFRPRSDFKPLPSGTVYVDADRYRIIHEEFTFDRNPFPLLVKNVKRISRHWKELPGGEWVVSKILMDVSLRGGWTGVMPEAVKVGVFFDDYVFDPGYDARRFGPR